MEREECSYEKGNTNDKGNFTKTYCPINGDNLQGTKVQEATSECKECIFSQVNLQKVYISQLLDMRTTRSLPKYVGKLNKVIYGLKQATKSWYIRSMNFLIPTNFYNNTTHSFFFVYNKDDILI